MNATDTTVSGEGRGRGRWIWDHIGMISGGILALLTVIGIAFLAAIGFKPALYLLVVVVAGVALIIVGGRIKGS